MMQNPRTFLLITKIFAHAYDRLQFTPHYNLYCCNLSSILRIKIMKKKPLRKVIFIILPGIKKKKNKKKKKKEEKSGLVKINGGH